jgi:hypothetical protein
MPMHAQALINAFMLHHCTICTACPLHHTCTHCGTVHGARHASHMPARHGPIATQNFPTAVCSGPRAACMPCSSDEVHAPSMSWTRGGVTASSLKSCCCANPHSRCRYNANNLFTHKHVRPTGHTATRVLRRHTTTRTHAPHYHSHASLHIRS